MEKVKVEVCIRPYRHDVAKTITRKPKYLASKDCHVVTFNGRQHELQGIHNQTYHIWIDEEY